MYGGVRTTCIQITSWIIRRMGGVDEYSKAPRLTHLQRWTMSASAMNDQAMKKVVTGVKNYCKHPRLTSGYLVHSRQGSTAAMLQITSGPCSEEGARKRHGSGSSLPPTNKINETSKCFRGTAAHCHLLAYSQSHNFGLRVQLRHVRVSQDATLCQGRDLVSHKTHIKTYEPWFRSLIYR